jgi:hypothetical protein
MDATTRQVIAFHVRDRSRTSTQRVAKAELTGPSSLKPIDLLQIPGEVGPEARWRKNTEVQFEI